MHNPRTLKRSSETPAGTTPTDAHNHKKVAQMYLAKMLVLMLTTGCTVVFFASDDKYAYCATAAHCVKGETAQVQYDGKLIGIRWTDVDKEKDIAVGRAFVEHFPDLGAKIDRAKPGPADVIGFPQNKFEVRHADITGAERIIDGSEKDLLAIAPPLVGGTSGGAVVQDETLVGIVTHTTPAGGACVNGKCVQETIVRAGVPIETPPVSQRDAIIAAIASFLMHLWKDKQHAAKKILAAAATV